jgi:voltage-gated potassium channel
METNKFTLFDLVIIVLSVYVLLALCITSFVPLPEQTMLLLDIIDDCICIVFLIDFVVEFIHAGNKLKYMKWGWIDLISSIPSFGFLRVGRLFKLIRLLRILRAFRSTKILMHYVFKSKIKGTMISVTIITILLAIFSSIAILSVETEPNSNIKTAEDAIWWAISTLTTSSIEDKYPVTFIGKLIGVVLTLSGVGIFGTYTAYIASIFVGARAKEDSDKEMDVDSDE